VSRGLVAEQWDPQQRDISEGEDQIMADRMTQSQVVKHLAGVNGVSNKAAKAHLQSVVDLAIAQAKKNGIFVLPGLGRLKKVQRKARMGRNPATGEPIKIKASKKVAFRAAKELKEAV
jgi:DNA-binding protein HU-beta